MFIEYEKNSSGVTTKDSLFISYPLKTGNPSTLGLFEYNSSTHVTTKTTDVSFNSSKTYYVPMGKYILDVKFGSHKLWGDDTGRNLAGTFSGTFKGIFPKITMQFRKLTKTEIEFLTPVLDSAYQSTIYYDTSKKYYVAMNTYSNDWEQISKHIISGNTKTEGFSWAVISRSKRS